MKLKLEPNEINLALRHLSAYEKGCWLNLALHYVEQSGQVYSKDDGELKAITGCSDQNYARVKGQLLSGRAWMFKDCGKSKLVNAEIDSQMEVARQQTEKARQAKE